MQVQLSFCGISLYEQHQAPYLFCLANNSVKQAGCLHASYLLNKCKRRQSNHYAGHALSPEPTISPAKYWTLSEQRCSDADEHADCTTFTTSRQRVQTISLTHYATADSFLQISVAQATNAFSPQKQDFPSKTPYSILSQACSPQDGPYFGLAMQHAAGLPWWLYFHRTLQGCDMELLLLCILSAVLRTANVCKLRR